MRFGWSPKDSSSRIRGVAKIAAIVFLAVYIVLYLKEPFSDLWNGILINLLLVIAAAATATVATMVWARYDKDDTPRRIWLYFAIGLWLWTAAELIYGFLDVTQEEVSIGLPDVFWVVAYIFFAHALFGQYRVLAGLSRREIVGRALAALAALLVVYLLVYRLLITTVSAGSQLDALVDSFYPVADLFLAIFAVWLLRHFQGGAFARPWLGLLAFAFTDLLYAWIDTSGLYGQANNIWTSLFDTTYIAAYLVLGLGILSQWAFLKYGLRSSPSEP